LLYFVQVFVAYRDKVVGVLYVFASSVLVEI
jgi:hypothetical protein